MTTTTATTTTTAGAAVVGGEEPAEVDATAAAAFAESMFGAMLGGCTALLVSLGQRTGLLDALEGRPPRTSEQIARDTGLQERYVREWLGGVTTAGIVRYHPDTHTYVLPPEHAACLTSSAGADDLSRFLRYVGLMGRVENGLVDAFRTGGGVPYSAVPEFQTWQDEENGPFYDAVLLDRVVPFVPGLAARLDAGIDVLDVGCGKGHALVVLAGAHPRSRFTGVDVSDEAVAGGRAAAAARGLGNLTFERRGSTDLPGTYDLVTTFDVVHDLAEPGATLAAVRRALRPGGTFLMGDIAGPSALEEQVDNPLSPMLYAFSLFHCMTVSLAQGGEGLGTAWGEQAAEALLREAGFGDVVVEHLDDPLHVFYVARPTGVPTPR